MSRVYAAIAPKIALPQPLLIKVTYTRCATHTGGKKLATLATLGLRHLHQSMIHKNVRPIRGMLNKVRIRCSTPVLRLKVRSMLTLACFSSCASRSRTTSLLSPLLLFLSHLRHLCRCKIDVDIRQTKESGLCWNQLSNLVHSGPDGIKPSEHAVLPLNYGPRSIILRGLEKWEAHEMR